MKNLIQSIGLSVCALWGMISTPTYGISCSEGMGEYWKHLPFWDLIEHQHPDIRRLRPEVNSIFRLWYPRFLAGEAGFSSSTVSKDYTFTLFIPAERHEHMQLQVVSRAYPQQYDWKGTTYNMNAPFQQVQNVYDQSTRRIKSLFPEPIDSELHVRRVVTGRDFSLHMELTSPVDSNHMVLTLDFLQRLRDAESVIP